MNPTESDTRTASEIHMAELQEQLALSTLKKSAEQLTGKTFFTDTRFSVPASQIEPV